MTIGPLPITRMDLISVRRGITRSPRGTSEENAVHSRLVASDQAGPPASGAWSANPPASDSERGLPSGQQNDRRGSWRREARRRPLGGIAPKRPAAFRPDP